MISGYIVGPRGPSAYMMAWGGDRPGDKPGGKTPFLELLGSKSSVTRHSSWGLELLFENLDEAGASSFLLEFITLWCIALFGPLILRYHTGKCKNIYMA